MHLEAVFSAQHNAPYFPVPLNAMHAEMKFHELVEGSSFDVGGAKVTCARLNHPWVAIAYRVDVDGASVVYCSDTAPFSDMLLGRDFIERPSFGTLPPPIQDELKQMRAGIGHLLLHVAVELGALRIGRVAGVDQGGVGNDAADQLV